jgi:integrase
MSTEPMPAIQAGYTYRDSDGLHKRRGIWHYKLKIDGRWREISTHTNNYQQARRIRQQALQAQEEGRLPIDRGKWVFRKAVEEWLKTREGDRLAENTRRVERERLRPLHGAFGERRLCQFTIDDIKAYRLMRSAKVGPRTINLEMKILRMILQWAKCWGRLADDYKPLRENTKGPGIALTPEEERRLFETANGNPQWDAAYLASLIAVNTTMRACELKGLCLGDIDLFAKAVSIRRDSTKTDAGCREIPLNDTALWAVVRLMERARVLGATDVEHFLFPAFRFKHTKGSQPVVGAAYDPTQAMKTWRTAWRSLKKAAGLPKLRFHDLRHTCITKLAEAGVPDHVLMSISGHLSPEMIKHYSHIRSKAKQAAVAAIQSYHPPEVREITPAPLN